MSPPTPRSACILLSLFFLDFECLCHSFSKSTIIACCLSRVFPKGTNLFISLILHLREDLITSSQTALQFGFWAKLTSGSKRNMGRRNEAKLRASDERMPYLSRRTSSKLQY